MVQKRFIMKKHAITPESKITKAFTLVELVVAFTIIGILAGLLLPALAKARANRTNCVNNVAQIGKAFMGFSNDNNNRLPGQLTLGGLKFQFGTEDSKCTHAIFSLQAMKSNSMPLNKATEINCLGFVGGNIK